MDSNDLAHWRVRIFSSLMSVVLGLALLNMLPGAIISFRHGPDQVVLIEALAAAWIGAIWYLDRLPYAVRVWNLVAMMFGVALSAMLAADALAVSYMLMAPPVMAVIFLGMPQALATLALSAVSILVLGLTGHTQFALSGLASDSLTSVLSYTVSFTCIGAFLTLTCGALLSGLSRSLIQVRTDAELLEKGKTSLQAANGELRLTSAALAGLNEMVLIAQVVESPGATQPIMFANAAFQRRSGYRSDEIVGRSLRMLHGPRTEASVVATITDAMARREPVSGELVHYTKSGEPYWVEIDVVPFASEQGSITHWVIVGRDITERRCAADAIHQLAFFDVLTGLPNRRLLLERLEVLVARAHAGERLGGVLYIDLDNFKGINDARGHATGDTLLKLLAERLRATVREGDTVARLGGDEFVVLLEDLGPDIDGARAAALMLAGQLRAALTAPVDIDGQQYCSSGSIGVALPARPAQTVHDLLREADTAMYHAKAAGAGGVALFEPRMLTAAEEKLVFERDLAHAVTNDELALHLQLQVDADGKPVGAEALLRWRRGDGVPVPPDVFIPVAEASGIIVQLGDWVLRQACLAWLALDRAGIALPLSVNVSPRQFREPGFVASVCAALRETGVPPGQLIFEVTEGLLVDDLDEVVARMRELSLLGIRFSVDDFGTGYSNLAYLSKMPLYELKIDKSLLRGVPDEVNGSAIVQSILAMAGHLGLRVVAEGIETPTQARFLAEHGAPLMQGYLFARPQPLADIIEQLSIDGPKFAYPTNNLTEQEALPA